MEAVSSVALLIPSYQPDAGLLTLVRGLRDKVPCEIFVVDDASSSPHSKVFEKLDDISNITVLRHRQNQGKGAALKTGFRAIAQSNCNLLGVITLDSDGQHSISSVLAVLKEFAANPDTLVLGARRISKDMPLLNYIGNRLSSKWLYCVTGRLLIDSQTGLRAIPRAVFEGLLALKSNRFDFETEMLTYALSEGIPISETPIETIYHGGRRRSHFRPVWDSLRIAKIMVRFWCSRMFCRWRLDRPESQLK